MSLPRRMTIEEKAMHLSCVVPLTLLGPDGPMRGQLDGLLGHGIGHVAGLGLIGHKTPATIARTVNVIQRYLVTETRLQIPALFHNEALNGVVAPHFTAFPTPNGLPATWDPAAVEEMGVDPVGGRRGPHDRARHHEPPGKLPVSPCADLRRNP